MQLFKAGEYSIHHEAEGVTFYRGEEEVSQKEWEKGFKAESAASLAARGAKLLDEEQLPSHARSFIEDAVEFLSDLPG